MEISVDQIYIEQSLNFSKIFFLDFLYSVYCITNSSFLALHCPVSTWAQAWGSGLHTDPTPSSYLHSLWR